MEANLENKAYAIKCAEKKRFTWEGIAVWSHLSHTFKPLKNLGEEKNKSLKSGQFSHHLHDEIL
jgi:hypothetical protein